MIPYDDLVYALQSWRSKQGLPVSSAMVVPAAPAPGSGGTRTAPPVAPPAPQRAASVVESLDDAEEFVEEGAYEAEGASYEAEAAGYQAADVEAEVEPTAIGEMPAPDAAPARTDDDQNDW